MRQTLRIRARQNFAKAALLSLALLLPGQALAQDRAFGPAETLTYDCRYLGLSVGKAQVMVGGATTMNGRSIWPVMALARTDPMFALYPIQDKFVTWWDPATGTTLGSEFLVNEKNLRKRERVRYARAEGRALTTRERSNAPRDETTYEVPGDAHDVLSAVLAVRSRKLAVGDHLELPVFTGKKNFTLKIDVEKKETVEVGAGRFDTVVLLVYPEFTGNLATKREIRIFVTDDVRHIPVKIDAEFLVGSFIADLTTYQKGLTN